MQIVVIGEKGREEGVGREQGGGGGEEIEDHVVPEGADFQGIIRREDIRAMEKDKVKVEESFRVGDLVRGEVVSLSFFLFFCLGYTFFSFPRDSFYVAEVQNAPLFVFWDFTIFSMFE